MKYFITSMSNNDLENLKEFYNQDILPYFDGVIHTLHDTDKDTEAAKFLESIKGDGEIIYRKYNSRNDFSMNEILYCGKMSPNDIFVFADSLERVQLPFVIQLRTEVTRLMKNKNIGCIYYYGKPFTIRYSENLRFAESPHWTLQGIEGYVFDLKANQPDENLVRLNVRPVKRTDKFHFVEHYLRYLMMPAGSNTMYLGLHNRGNPQELFPIVEKERLEFREYVRNKGLTVDVKGVKKLLESPLDEQGKDFFRKIKILNDYYRHYILKDDNFIDDHDYNNRISIE